MSKYQVSLDLFRLVKNDIKYKYNKKQKQQFKSEILE